MLLEEEEVRDPSVGLPSSTPLMREPLRRIGGELLFLTPSSSWSSTIKKFQKDDTKTVKKTVSVYEGIIIFPTTGCHFRSSFSHTNAWICAEFFSVEEFPLALCMCGMPTF